MSSALPLLLSSLASATPAGPGYADPALPGTFDAPPPTLVAPIEPDPVADTGAGAMGTPHVLLRNDWIYPAPRRTRARRGRVTRGEVVLVEETVEGSGCRGDWGRLDGDGYLCLDRTEPTGESPTALPRLVAFDAPEPSEFWSYVETGTWDRSPDAVADPLVPWIYGKRWRRWQGVFYDDVDDFERWREPSEDQLDGNRKYHFSRIEPSTRGPVLVRRNGQVVPMDGIHLCSTRLRLLELNTADPIDPVLLSDVEPLRRRTGEELRSMGRLGTPMRRLRGEAGFRPIGWEEALGALSSAMRDAGPDRSAVYLTSRGLTNEVYYAAAKAVRAQPRPWCQA